MANKIPYKVRQEIIKQALNEITFARDYKQGKTRNWKINEDMYYSRKNSQNAVSGTVSQTVPAGQNAQSQANVDLGQMAAFVHTILSKIDTPLVFKYTKRKRAQLRRAQLINAIRVSDQSDDFWDIKDLAGKKQATIYGRAIFSYYADSYEGYCSHLDNVDVYDFLIDPAAGGINIERAMYLGDYGVIKSRQELKDGIKSGIYLKTETERLLDGDGNSTEETQEELNKKNRTRDTNVTTAQKEIGNKDKFKFWRWGTTYDGQRYYLVLSETGAQAIEITPIEDKFESKLWWYWTYAAFIDLTEFWSPSYCDYVREVFMAQATSINQMLDNGERINKPQKVVNVGAIENLTELKYRREGYIKVKKEFDVNKALQTLVTPSIDTPLKVFDKLDAIQEKASGVTAAAQGAAENDGQSKVAIYNGNQENSADRFGLFNKSYSFGYKRFAKLHEWGVREHLIQKKSVEILGPEGVELVSVSKRDIFRKSESFGLLVESSNAETALSEKEKSTKINFLQAQAAIPQTPGVPPTQNPKKAYEIMASIAGFDEETIRQLQDTSDYGDEEIMAEADRDIERLLDGDKFLPNQGANTAYKQRFVDYLKDHQEDISDEDFKTIGNYVLLLDPIIERNMTAQANAILFKQRMAQIMQPEPTAPVTTPAGNPAKPPNGGGRGL